MAARSLRDMVARQQSLATKGTLAEEVRVLRASSVERAPRRSTFIVEALLLLTCLMVVIAVSISVIAFSASKGTQSAHMENGIIMATNIAEQFAADPASLQETYVEGDYTANCSLALSMDNAGSMYDAVIDITWKDQPVYTLTTSKYVSHAEAPSDGDDGQVM